MSPINDAEKDSQIDENIASLKAENASLKAENTDLRKQRDSLKDALKSVTDLLEAQDQKQPKAQHKPCWGIR